MPNTPPVKRSTPPGAVGPADAPASVAPAEGSVTASAGAVRRYLTDKKVAEFEVIAQRRDVDGPMQDRALEIVRKFIVSRGLVLYGGLAIDYALKAAGREGIYSDEERPDYDFFSPTHVADAYDLADELAKLGFANVGAIRAIHVSTMRVKSDFVFVADISYVPPEIYAALPTISYRQMRVLHPDYQRMDLHLSLCYPFEDAPRENIFNRWKKDLKRYNLLDAAYPIRASAESPSLPIVALTVAAPAGGWKDVAVHGFAAYGLLREALEELKIAVDAPRMPAKLTPTEITFHAPKTHDYLAVATPKPKAVCEAFGDAKAEHFSVYMDSQPKKTVLTRPGRPAVHVHSTENRLLSVTRHGAGADAPLVVSAQSVLLYFLSAMHRARAPPERAMLKQYYAWTLAVLRAASEHARAGGEAASRKLATDSPFALSTLTLGEFNYSASFLIRLAKTVTAVEEKDPPAALGLPTLAELKNLSKGLPADYYPGRARPPPFDYAASAKFLRDGSKIGAAPPAAPATPATPATLVTPATPVTQAATGEAPSKK